MARALTITAQPANYRLVIRQSGGTNRTMLTEEMFDAMEYARLAITSGAEVRVELYRLTGPGELLIKNNAKIRKELGL
jgi:hypothetical protein